MKLDILVLAAHPDDAELNCSGTIIKHIEMGKQVGIVDLTKGELGTRGNVETREKEAKNASELMGIAVRDNLEMDDGFFLNDRQHQLEIVKVVRKFKPEIVLANAIEDRHPDHGRAAQLIKEGCFLAGLRKIKTELEDRPQQAWRPKHLFHFIQSRYIQPDFVVDISDYWDKKMEAVKAYKSQFYDPDSKEPETFVSSPQFLELIKSRATDLGYTIGVKYAEGFNTERYLGVNSLFDIL